VPDLVLETMELGFVWPTIDPFLFCVHHDDAYPAGNEILGPGGPLSNRRLGSDFEGIDGWRMYHGLTVPGFPQHPHRGFETVTYIRRGIIDHSDSLGAAARFGAGDTQWLTAGRGVVHSEMFPLLDRHGPNPLELFQIWMNLPAVDKMVEPYFTMFWSHQMPVRLDPGAEVTVIAGALGDLVPPPPPPNSWAARPDADVAIWHVRLQPGAQCELPPAAGADTVRTLYFFVGSELRLDGGALKPNTGVVVRPDRSLTLEAGSDAVEVLVLQGRPIGEPVAQAGPFVMNNEREIEQAFADYQRTGFGGWPWPADDPVHGAQRGRFARHADGRLEEIEAVVD